MEHVTEVISRGISKTLAKSVLEILLIYHQISVEF